MSWHPYRIRQPVGWWELGSAACITLHSSLHATQAGLLPPGRKVARVDFEMAGLHASNTLRQQSFTATHCMCSQSPVEINVYICSQTGRWALNSPFQRAIRLFSVSVLLDNLLEAVDDYGLSEPQEQHSHAHEHHREELPSDRGTTCQIFLSMPAAGNGFAWYLTVGPFEFAR